MKQGWTWPTCNCSQEELRALLREPATIRQSREGRSRAASTTKAVMCWKLLALLLAIVVIIQGALLVYQAEVLVLRSDCCAAVEFDSCTR